MNKLMIYVLLMVMVLAVPVLVSADITTDLVEHWMFDEDTSSEKSSNVGQIMGNSAWITGVDGQAILVLKKAYISVLDTLFPSGSAARTISIVVQLKADPAANNGEVVLSYGSTSDNGNSFILVQETDGLGINFNGHTWGTPSRYSGWTHIIVVIPDNAVNTSSAQIYVNGKLIVTSTLAGSVCPLNTINSGHAYIGKDISSQNPVDYLDAGVDDLRIYNRALTTDDIQELYAIYRPVIEQRGEKGWSPNLAVEENSTLNKTVLKLRDWVGGEGQTPSVPGPYLGSNGFVSTIEDAVNIKGAPGTPGTNGTNGTDGTNGTNGTDGLNGLSGWSPVFGIETVSDKSVLKIVDWTGSSGIKPTSTDVYVGLTGFTSIKADAVNIRGPQGPAGSSGGAVQKGYINGACVKYKDSTTVTITAGNGECNGNYWESNTDIDLNLTGQIPTTKGFVYIYIAGDSAFPVPTFTGSVTPPSFDNVKFGWYNGNNRCMGVVWVENNSILSYVSNDEGNSVEVTGTNSYSSVLRLVDAFDPLTSNLWQDVDGTNGTKNTSQYLPVNCSAILIFSEVQATQNGAALFVGTKENRATQFRINGTTLIGATGWVLLGTSRTLSFCSYSIVNKVFIDRLGFKYCR